MSMQAETMQKQKAGGTEVLFDQFDRMANYVARRCERWLANL